MTYQILCAKDDNDFGNIAKDAFHATMMGVEDLPWVVLPTGNTPKPLYDALRSDKDFRPFQYLQLDEYLGLEPDDPILFSNWLARDVLDPLNIRHRMIFNSAANPEQEIMRIKAWYDKYQRMDVAVLGIGEDGHIGFNLPGCSLGSRTHMATLNEQTRAANHKYWGKEVPKNVLTLGISELRLASSTILLARGPDKAKPLAQALLGPITDAIPASYLQLQENVIIVADKAALSLMS